jgi:hypothetical protein
VVEGDRRGRQKGIKKMALNADVNVLDNKMEEAQAGDEESGN